MPTGKEGEKRSSQKRDLRPRRVRSIDEARVVVSQVWSLSEVDSVSRGFGEAQAHQAGASGMWRLSGVSGGGESGHGLRDELSIGSRPSDMGNFDVEFFSRDEIGLGDATSSKSYYYGTK